MAELPLWLGEQQKRYSCGAASLKYALCVMGFSPREEQLRKLARTSWQSGTKTKNLVAAARRFGVKAELRQFFDDAWPIARDWLHNELAKGRPVILDVDGFEHYVVAVQTLGARIVVVDPEGGPMDGSAYARVLLCGDERLRRWWLSGEEDGEPEAFRGLSLRPPAEPPKAKGAPRLRGPRLQFSEKAVRRYLDGRVWILDEYLVDVVEMATGAAGGEGEMKPLSEVIRAKAKWVIERVAWWREASPGEIMMMKAHVEDMAVAADAMQLSVPERATNVAVDVASILTAMLDGPE